MFTVRRLVITVLLAVAIGALVVAAQQVKETDKGVTITDAAVKEVYPANGDLDLRQSRIWFKLDPTYTGRLELRGPKGNFQIPDDQLRYVIGLNQYEYTPGPGTETGPLSPGRYTAVAYIWKRGQSEATARPYPWSFNVH